MAGGSVPCLVTLSWDSVRRPWVLSPLVALEDDGKLV